MNGEAQQPALGANAREKSPLMEMLSIAAPVVAGMTSFTAMQMLDKWMVAHIGPDPIYVGAQGNGGLCAWAPIAVAHGALTVVNTYVAQNLGAKTPERGPAYAWAGAWLSLAFYFVVMIPFGLAMPWFVALMGGSGDAAAGVTPAEQARFEALAASYGQILVFGSIITLLARCIGQYFYGMHRPGIVLAGTVTGNIINFVLNSFLIFGPVACVTGVGWLDAWFRLTAEISQSLGVPRLEMAGAAIATVCGTLFELLIPLALFVSPKFVKAYGTLKAWRPDLKPMRDIFRIGWPGGLMFGNEMVCWAIFMVAQVGHFGPRHSTAGWIAHQWMSLSFMPAVGISIAITAMVGKAMGMGRPDIAAQRAWLGLKVSVAYMSLCAVMFVVFRHHLVDVFIDPGTPAADRELLISVGGKFLIAVATFQFFDAIAMSLSGALRGAGDTRWVGVVTVALSWLVIVAGGWAMVYWAPGLGSLGPWITASAYIVLLALAILWRFVGGKWRSMKLVDTPAQTPA
jgi:MATE family multidrug resistance protein